MNKNLGFGLIGIILTVAFGALIGIVGWKIYDANQNRQPSAAASQDQQPASSQQAAGAAYLAIQEWGVKLTLSNTIKDATYSLDSHTQWVRLTTPRLAELSGLHPGCADADESITISRAKPGDDHLGSPWQESILKKIGTKVGEFYYYPTLGQPCFLESGSSTPEEITQIRTELTNAIKSVEAIN